MAEITKKQADAIDALCRLKFDAFAHRAFRIVEPGSKYEWSWHLGCVGEHLEAVYAGQIDRIIFNLPPRSLKSYLISSAYPAWVMGKHPEEKFINAGFGLEVVEQNAMKCRKILDDPWFQHCFPGLKIDPVMDRLTHFRTTMGGQYYANTALSTMTGLGCKTMTIDDPIKPMESQSEGIRNKVNENIRATLLNRFDDKRLGKVCVVMQRSHEDDATGNLLKDGGWVHVKLPAEATHRIQIQLGKQEWIMEAGDLLFPARLSKKELERTRTEMTDYHYVGQYLQEPAAIGGGEFREEWMQYYKFGGVKPKDMNIVILVDAASGEELNKKKRKTSDWTAMIVVGLASDNCYYLLDMVRDRLNPTERIDTLFMLHRKWNSLSGKPPKVGYERYGLMSDTHYIKQKMETDAYRFSLVELGGQMMKEERIRRLIPDLQMGRWWLPENLMYIDSEGRTFDLVKELVYSEMKSFPRARFDDCLDALSRVYEGDLFMQFPKPKANPFNKMMQPIAQPDNWLDY